VFTGGYALLLLVYTALVIPEGGLVTLIAYLTLLGAFCAATDAEGDFLHIPIGTTHWFEVLDAPVKVLAGYCPAGEELAFL
jgi:hypothetical protein